MQYLYTVTLSFSWRTRVITASPVLVTRFFCFTFPLDLACGAAGFVTRYFLLMFHAFALVRKF